jgi:hypothetical protein
VVLFVDRKYAKTLHFLAEPVHLDAARTEPSAIGGTLIPRSCTVSGPEKLQSCTEAQIPHDCEIR